MNPIRTNKPVFFGDDGEVLKSGQIYIGQPNQWPLSFPKTVTLQDSAGSQFAAAQPLTTNNQGRIEYNGKSVIALVDGDYSILVRDRNGVTVGEGYTPFVENSAAGGGGGTTEGVTQVGLILSDIKQFNVTPGDTVRNVGKATTLDGLGADWLVVSNTGSAGDDVDLIDFTNGTQGKRTENNFYTIDIIGLANGGTGADNAADARTNLDVYSTTETDTEISGLASGAAGSPKIEDAALDTSATNAGRDWVLARTALTVVGAVGSYALLRNESATEFEQGDTTAGSNLVYAAAAGGAGPTATSPAGTWRAMGFADDNSAAVDARTTLWLRIS